MRSYAIVPLLSSAVLASPAAWNPSWDGNKQPGWGWGSWGRGKQPFPHGPPPHGSPNAVAYFLYNDPTGNSIVSLKIGQDGKLSDPMKTPTGGVGSLEVDNTGAPFMSDTLGSQGSVCVKDNVRT